MENRAAVFTSTPQAVEVYRAGGWWPGELLGWRHAADGSCQVWVRVVLGGAAETAWTDLGTLRLPERHLAMAPAPAGGESAGREASVARHPSSRRDLPADSEESATTSMPTVRDLSLVPDVAVPPPGARRRAPEMSSAAAGGRGRAPEEPAAASTGGRRRAPETTTDATAIAGRSVTATGGRRRAPEEPVSAPLGGRRRAPEDAAPTTSSPAAAVGRHSAAPLAVSADPGRHRTADTGVLAAVSDAPGAVAGSRRLPGPAASTGGGAVPLAHPAGPEAVGSGDSVSAWSAPSGLEAEVLTRPMRLSDHLPHSRRPRLNGSPRGV